MSDINCSKKAGNEQLIPCPFCGGKARVLDHNYMLPPRYGIICGGCGARSQQFYGTIGEAVAAWNTRVPDEMSAVEFLKIIDNLHYYDHEACQQYAGRKLRHDYAGAVAIVEKWAREHPMEANI